MTCTQLNNYLQTPLAYWCILFVLVYINTGSLNNNVYVCVQVKAAEVVGGYGGEGRGGRGGGRDGPVREGKWEQMVILMIK